MTKIKFVLNFCVCFSQLKSYIYSSMKIHWRVALFRYASQLRVHGEEDAEIRHKYILVECLQTKLLIAIGLR